MAIPIPRGQRAVSVVLWLAVAPFTIWLVVRLARVEPGWPVVQLIAFTPYVASGCAVVAIVVIALRRWVAGVVAVLTAIAMIWTVAPRALADGGRLPDGPRLRVLSANLLLGGADTDAVIDLVRRLDVDLLALQEYTSASERAFADGGIDNLLPYRVGYPRSGVTGSALYARHPLSDGALRVHASGFSQAKAVLTVPGAPPVEVESVHPAAPSDRVRTRYWKRDMRDQPPASADGPLRILLGDFNATLDHASMRRLINTGYRDAAAVVGSGLTGTWPNDERWYIPPVALDRVLADRRIGVRAWCPYPIPNSDHKAVYAELVLPAS